MKSYKCVTSRYLDLARLQDQPPVSSRRSDIIFDSKIEILTLRNPYHEGMYECDLYILLASRISLEGPPGERYYFWHENCNFNLKKPISIYIYMSA